MALLLDPEEEDLRARAYEQPDGYWCLRGQKKTIYVHKVVAARLGLAPGQIDHVNRTRGDCRRENLRPATWNQNQWNRGKYKTAKSAFKGVTQNRAKWRAAITTYGKRINLGTFDTEQEASHAYLEAAKRLHGEFAA